MQRTDGGEIVVLSAGEQLADSSRSPDDKTDMCLDWREKAFELARETETLSSEKETLALRLKLSEDLRLAAESKLKSFAAITVASWVLTLGLLAYIIRG